MKDKFIIQQIWDLSWRDKLKYSNLFFPFLRLVNNNSEEYQINEKIIELHKELMNSFSTLDDKIFNLLSYLSDSYKKIDDKVWKYLKNENNFIALEYENPSDKLKKDFFDIIEESALLIQNIARLCLKITNQSSDVLTKTNLVSEYEKLLNQRYWSDKNFTIILENDKEWTKMIKELRNEGWRHSEWDKSWVRKLNFIPLEIKLENWSKPLLVLPYFEFNHSEWTNIIYDFQEFLQTLMNNIFDLSIDRLVFAYSKLLNLPINMVYSLIKSNWIEEKK